MSLIRRGDLLLDLQFGVAINVQIARGCSSDAADRAKRGSKALAASKWLRERLLRRARDRLVECPALSFPGKP